MLTLKEYRESRGQDPVQLASELSALLGKRISRQAVNLYSSKPLNRIPKAWAEALRIDTELDDPLQVPVEPAGPDTSTRGNDDPFTGRVHDESPPTPPPGSVEPPAQLPVMVASHRAAERIATIYGLLGSAMSARTNNPGYRLATDKQAPVIAQAWIRAAEENEFVRRLVGYLDSGGSTGELVQVHVVWLATILYISGRIPNVGGMFGQYERYRVVIPDAPPADLAGSVDEQPEREPFRPPWAFTNGASANRPTGAVADDPASAAA